MDIQALLTFKNSLMRLALRILQQREEAEDVVQDTYVKLWNQRESLDKIENIEAYALTLCRNLALDHQKAAHHQMEESFDATPSGSAAFGSMSIDPSERIEQRDRLSRIRKAMDTLPEKQRVAMHLRDFEGHSYKR